MESPSEVHVLALDRHHCLAVFRGLNVQCWDETHPDAVDDNFARLSPILHMHQGPTATLVILEPDAPPPDAMARKRLDELARLLVQKALCVAYVYQGTGFRAAAVRGVMVALTFVDRHRVPTKICSTVPEALAFMSPHLGDEKHFGTRHEREEAVATVQRRFASRPREA